MFDLPHGLSPYLDHYPLLSSIWIEKKIATKGGPCECHVCFVVGQATAINADATTHLAHNCILGVLARL